jgi:hypothetical protein
MLTYVPIANTCAAAPRRSQAHCRPKTRTARPLERSRRHGSQPGFSCSPRLIGASQSAPSISRPPRRSRLSDRARPQGVPAARRSVVTLVEIVEPAALDENDSYSIEAGPTGMEILADETARSRSATSVDSEDDRRSGALDAGVRRGVRVPPRMADQRRARGRQGAQGSRARRFRKGAAPRSPHQRTHQGVSSGTRLRRGRRPAWAASSGRRAPKVKIRTPIYALNGGEISRRMGGRIGSRRDL